MAKNSNKKEIKNKKEETKTVSAIKPHITEKAAFLGESGAYVFKIKPNFNKIMIKEAVKNQYNVSPVKISIINTPAKTVFLRRKRAEKPGYKKAVVYLKKGDKISLA